MSTKAFLLLIAPLILLFILSSPPVLGPLLYRPPTATVTPTPITPTTTLTPTPDPLAHVPTATPRSGQAVLNSLPTPSLGDLPPTFTPTTEVRR